MVYIHNLIVVVMNIIVNSSKLIINIIYMYHVSETFSTATLKFVDLQKSPDSPKKLSLQKQNYIKIRKELIIIESLFDLDVYTVR